MKTKLCYLLFLSLFFISCQKEYSFENINTNTSTFTFDGAPSACTTPTINGFYMVGVALTATNTVNLSVTVTKIGTYTINTNTTNGMSFSGTGTFTILGSQTITLTATGTPVASGPYSFTPTTAGCSFSVTVLPALPPATFTYANTSGVCTAPLISGTYTAGTALNSTNTIDLDVTVTVAGSYSVSTNAANGVTFSGSGILVQGAQTITLTSNSTPTAAGTFNYTPKGGCSFPITFAAALVPATFTYTNTSGVCTAPVISGTYKAGTALNSTNTIVLGVNVTVAGTYSVSTNALNGVTFSGAGILSATGAQTITLTSTNTPTAAGTFNYTPTGGCSFPITFAAAGPPAVFTLDGAPNACTVPQINGTYKAGTALNSTNTIVLAVTVTVAGSYSISTNAVNGVTFSGSGMLATGAQTITLTSTNTPTAAGSFDYTPAGGCIFSITYAPGPSGGGDFLKCTIDGVVTNFNDNLGGASGSGSFDVSGDNGTTSNLDLIIQDNSMAPIAVGTYNNFSVSNLSKFSQVIYTPNLANSSAIWGAFILNSNSFSITIQTISATKATGIFSGAIYDINGANKKVVTNGSFSITF